jgi:hypothetical protein
MADLEEIAAQRMLYKILVITVLGSCPVHAVPGRGTTILKLSGGGIFR